MSAIRLEAPWTLDAWESCYSLKIKRCGSFVQELIFNAFLVVAFSVSSLVKEPKSNNHIS